MKAIEYVADKVKVIQLNVTIQLFLNSEKKPFHLQVICYQSSRLFSALNSLHVLKAALANTWC